MTVNQLILLLQGCSPDKEIAIDIGAYPKFPVLRVDESKELAVLITHDYKNYRL